MAFKKNVYNNDYSYSHNELQKITFPQYIAVLENKVFEERKQENSRGCGRRGEKRCNAFQKQL